MFVKSDLSLDSASQAYKDLKKIGLHFLRNTYEVIKGRNPRWPPWNNINIPFHIFCEPNKIDTLVVCRFICFRVPESQFCYSNFRKTSK